MARLAEIEGRIATVTELGSIVDAMRAMAAVRIERARAAIEGIERYTDVVDRALARVVPHLAAPPAAGVPVAGVQTIVVVFASEHGFVGAYNRHLVERASELAKRPDTELFVTGSRGARLAAEAGLEPTWTAPMATHPDGVLALSRRLSDALDRRIGAAAEVRLDLVFMRFVSRARTELTVRRVLPPELSVFRRPSADTPPVTHLDGGQLLAELVGEYLLAELTRAAMESLASENATRLVTMQSASESVSDELDDLHARARTRRQTEITTELLDVVAGAEALRDDAEDE